MQQGCVSNVLDWSKEMELQGIRVFIQWVALIGSNIYIGFLSTKQIYQGATKSACVPFLNCHSCPSALFACPIGTLQHFMTLHRIPGILLGYLLAIGITVGSLACGWLCPFGFLQDLMYKIRSFKIKIPKYLSHCRYIVLLFFVILIPFITQETWFSKLCPMGTIQAALPWVGWNPIIPIYNERAISTSAIGILFAIKLLILTLFLMLFIISKRPFCRVICPLGAIFGFFNKYSIIRLTANKEQCKNCNNCEKDCPVDINASKETNSTTCVRCFKCLKCESVNLEIGGFKEKVELVPASNLKTSD